MPFVCALALGLSIPAVSQTTTAHKTSGSRAAAHRAAPKASDPADPIVLTVGDQTVTASELNRIIAQLPPQTRVQAQAKPKDVAEQYGQMLALVQEAQRQHLDHEPEVQTQLRLTRNNALAGALVNRLRAQAQPSETAAKAFYDSHQDQFIQVRARHILITDSDTPNTPNKRTKAEAKAKIDAIAVRLKQGEDFAKIAKTESEDPGSKQNGGEYTFGHGQMVPEFEQKAFTLAVGQISEPFETRYGYHILKVEDRKPVPFDQVKGAIENQLVSDAVKQQVQGIVAQSHPVVNEAYFAKLAPGPAAPAQPGAGQGLQPPTAGGSAQPGGTAQSSGTPGEPSSGSVTASKPAPPR